MPLPYPNIATSKDAQKTAKRTLANGQPLCHKDSVFMPSTGDEAGSAGGGVASNKIKGKPAARALDPMLHNDKNTPPAPLMQPPLLMLEAMPPKLRLLTEEELALAASNENTPEAQKARRKVVQVFLRDHGQEFDPNTGGYYGDRHSLPDDLGINPSAMDSAGRITPKVRQEYRVSRGATYLESAAAPGMDFWSVKGQTFNAKGGHIQRVIGDRGLARAVRP